MTLNYDKLLNKANILYGIAAIKRQCRDPFYVAPEEFPEIASEQVKCFFRALVEELNSQDQ